MKFNSPFLIHFRPRSRAAPGALSGPAETGAARCPTLSYPCCSQGGYGCEDLDPTPLWRSTVVAPAAAPACAGRAAPRTLVNLRSRLKFLVLLDDSEDCGKAVYYASRRAVRLGARVSLLRVIDPPRTEPPSVLQPNRIPANSWAALRTSRPRRPYLTAPEAQSAYATCRSGDHDLHSCRGDVVQAIAGRAEPNS